MFAIIKSRSINRTAVTRLRALGQSEAEAEQLVGILRDGWKHSPRWRRDEVVELAPDAYGAGLEGRDMYRFYRATAVLAFTTGAQLPDMARILLRCAASGRLMPAELAQLEALGVWTWMLGRTVPHVAFRKLSEGGQLSYEHVVTSILEAREPRP